MSRITLPSSALQPAAQQREPSEATLERMRLTQRARRRARLALGAGLLLATAGIAIVLAATAVVGVALLAPGVAVAFLADARLARLAGGGRPGHGRVARDGAWYGDWNSWGGGGGGDFGGGGGDGGGGGC